MRHIMPAMPDVYSEYKPLRNYLRNTNLIQSLGAVRWYINYSQFPDAQPPANDMRVDPVFYKPMKSLIYLPPWYMAILARELIINSTPSSLRFLHDLREWNDMANAVNKLKAISEYVDGHYVNRDNVLHVFAKLYPHQQFVWQENKPNKQTMTRYYYIYRNPKLQPIFEKFFGMSVETHFVLGTLAWLNYKQFLGMNYPPDSFDSRFSVTLQDFDLFLIHYSQPLGKLREMLVDPNERKMDGEFLYYFDSLRRYPMILTKLQGKDSYICPVPTYLYWRVTDGIYYELCNESGFGQAIGDGFKDYIGEVLAENKYPKATQVIDADAFIAQNLPKPDWIVVKGMAAAFVECKAKRMTLLARTDINASPATDEQLKKLAESVVQCYLAVIDSNGRSYREMDAVTRIYPVVVTMENWYIYGDIMSRLKVKVLEVAVEKGVDPKFIEANPYLTLSAQEFETISVLLRTRSLEEIINPFFTDSR
jgi:hypothetical protein